MRPTRVIYVENDPALLGILSRLLSRRDEIEVVLATASAEEALSCPDLGRADVALIDLALGAHQMNGIDLGLAMRRANSNLGIVIHSQHSLDQVARRVPEIELIGWSTIAKSGQMRVDELCEVLTSTARGLSSRDSNPSDSDQGQLDDMSSRQRTVMGMAATGLSTKEIARRLSSTEGSVRQDLSRAYRILVPDSTEADDLRTRAVLAYLRLGSEQDHQ
jgi:DNA-binding NarL/FixJ family response regulator